jgi:hypothetical protein
MPYSNSEKSREYHKEYMKKWRATNQKERREKDKIYRDKYYKQRKLGMWKYHGIKHFDDTYDKYMECKFCELCNIELLDKGYNNGSGNKKTTKVLDHDHFSGYCRFIVCHKCNCFLRKRDNNKMMVHLELYRAFKKKKI